MQSPRTSFFGRFSLALGGWSRARSRAPGKRSFFRRHGRALLVVFVVLAAIFARPIASHARAAAFLLRLSGDPHPVLERSVASDRTTIDDAHGPISARLYVPSHEPLDALGGPMRAIVLAHGVHYLGIDEPRLVALAGSFARAGVVVLTPELSPLADYRVDDPRNLEILRASVHALAKRPGIAPGGVGLVGVSFAGGLSLRVATEPEVARDLAFVVSIGGHDDLVRVARFFATDVADTPEGPEPLRAHDYGVAVLVYEAPEKFVAPDQAEQLRVAVRAYLHESYALAEAEAQKLSPDARVLFERIAHRDTHALAPLVLAALPSLEAKMRDASPSGKLSAIRVPVYLLHGAHDNVVPSSESRWTAKEIGGSADVHLLVTSEIGHAELGEGGAWERAKLVHFMAEMLSD